jgi:hypothetical protein
MNAAIAGMAAVSAIRELLVRHPDGPNTEPFTSILMGTKAEFLGYRTTYGPGGAPWSRETVMAHVLGEALWFMSLEVKTTAQFQRFQSMCSRMCLSIGLLKDP